MELVISETFASPCRQCLMFYLPTDECGIVAQISEPLAAADIPAYYISTFKFDHALVSMNTASLE